MGAVLAPRGPDGEGTLLEGDVGLVHRRLKIIDLSERGAQPMLDRQAGLAIVFNGCIYNHLELRDELEAAGRRFHSTSDTEVILRAYQQWGPERFLERLVGMFAFALLETGPGGRLLLARDRLGIKPLYLADTVAGLRFASTLPALLAGGGIDTEIDLVALHHYLSFHSVVPAPRTILRGVRKLPPATVMEIDAGGRRRERRYWRASHLPDPTSAPASPAEWAERLREALRVSVRRRMVADVPVGVLLSGGLDSSVIVALLHEQGQRGLATFSIGFPDAGGRTGEEFEYSDLVAERFGTDHRRIEIGRGELSGALGAAIRAMSEPMVSHDVVAFHLLSREVARERKVVQSGQGADEILAGYSWYPPLLDAPDLGDEAYAREFVDRPHAELAEELAPGRMIDSDASRAFIRAHFAAAPARRPVDRALCIDAEVMLVEDPVKRLDNMTMAWGLEARTPFLDHELVELAARCPAELKLAHGGKGVLKEASRGLVPDEVIDRPKGYFPVPSLAHLDGQFLERVADALHSPAARVRGLFRPETVRSMLADPNRTRTALDGNRLWQLALLELWLQEHL